MSKRTTTTDTPVLCLLLESVCRERHYWTNSVIPLDKLSAREFELIERAAALHTDRKFWDCDAGVNETFFVAFLAVCGAQIDKRPSIREFFDRSEVLFDRLTKKRFEKLWDRAEKEIAIGAWRRYRISYEDDIPEGLLVKRRFVLDRP